MVLIIYGAYEQLIEHFWSDDGHTHTVTHSNSTCRLEWKQHQQYGFNFVRASQSLDSSSATGLVWENSKARRGWVTFGEVAWIFTCQGHINQVSRRRLTQWQDKAMTGLGSGENLTSSVSACAKQMVTRWGPPAPSAGFSVSRSPFPSLSTTSTSSTKRSAF